MSSPVIGLIAGLGNPGNQYAETRHNAGFWFLGVLQEAYGFTMKEDNRYKGLVGSFSFDGATIRVVAPQTFMNDSGDSVAPYARFFQIPPEQILVAYDELDLPLGAVRLKLDGGHGGHNGLRDVMQKTGSRDMKRLRIGIGHPGESKKVLGHVLSKPSPQDRQIIDGAIDQAASALPDILRGDFPKAMKLLHTN